jgi:hypothetical protein
MLTKDTASTLAGGGAGLGLLLTVRWEAVPHGELIKVGMVAFLILVGWAMYGGKNGSGTPKAT